MRHDGPLNSTPQRSQAWAIYYGLRNFFWGWDGHEVLENFFACDFSIGQKPELSLGVGLDVYPAQGPPSPPKFTTSLDHTFHS